MEMKLKGMNAQIAHNIYYEILVETRAKIGEVIAPTSVKLPFLKTCFCVTN